jgi:type I restriction enzyme S subunit
MRFGQVQASELGMAGLRLTGGFYLSEDQKAMRTLRRFAGKADRLARLAADGGIFRGPIFKRQYVDDPQHGVPYVSANDLDRVFVEPAGYLSHRVGKVIEGLRLREGMILVTCSGMTLGKAIWARSEMEDLVASHDLIRIVANPEVVPPGYLYAFLASRYGRVSIRRQIYGGSVKHIEPEHLRELSVPRVDPGVEKRVDELVRVASSGLSAFVRTIRDCTADVLRGCGLEDPEPHRWAADERRLGWEETKTSSLSLRAMNSDPRAAAILEAISKRESTPLGSHCVPSLFKGRTVFKRIDSNSKHGCQLVGQRKAFRPRPHGRWISKRSIAGLGLQVPAGTTLIPSHGTLGENELYCRAVYVTERTSEFAFSGDFFRCVPGGAPIHPGYLFAFLRSNLAFRLLRATSIGGKQQEQHPTMMWNLPIPRLAEEEEKRIGEMVDAAAKKYDVAMAAEDEALKLLEQAIGGGT